MKKLKNPYVERFVAGFCQAGTPFSTKISDEALTNPLKMKAKELMSNESLNFWDDDWAESFCYFGGGLLGLSMVPVDALITGVFTVKKTFVGAYN